MIYTRQWWWVLVACFMLSIPSVAWGIDQNVLEWTDNSNNELGFTIQRGTATSVATCSTAVFAPLATVGQNILTYTDTTVTQGVVYCYRVAASNSEGTSAPSNVAGRLVPFTVPVPPSNLIVR